MPGAPVPGAVELGDGDGEAGVTATVTGDEFAELRVPQFTTYDTVTGPEPAGPAVTVRVVLSAPRF